MNTDKPLGLGLVLLGGAGIVGAMQMHAQTFNDDPGPKLFPILACIILVICGAGLLLQRKTDAEDAAVPGSFGRGAVIFAALCLYALALWIVGFHIATPVGVFALYYIIAGPKRVLWQGVVYSIAVTVIVHLVFATLLGAYLPQGMQIWGA